MNLIMPFVIMAALGSAFLAWLAFGFGGVFELTVGLLGFCQDLFIRCVESAKVLEIALMWLGGAAIASGLVNALIRASAGMIRARIALRALPLAASAGRVRLIDDPAPIAFTFGLISPRIYLSRGLFRRLEHEELRGVFLHELHHMRRRDPLRFFAACFLKDAFFFIPLGAYLYRRVRSASEAEADLSAARTMDEPLSLASALIKVARFNTAGTAVSAGLASVGGADDPASTVEGRIRGLIEGTGGKTPGPGRRAVILSVFISAFIAATLAYPLGASTDILANCTTEHCETHMDELGGDCKAHCEDHSGGLHH